MNQGIRSSKSRQLKLFADDLRFFGGRLLHGKRRGQRPLAKKEAVHLVFRSSWAKDGTSFRKSSNRNPIERIILATAYRYGVRIYRKSIATNHVHLVLRITNRQLYATFIRVMKFGTSKVTLRLKKTIRTLLQPIPPDLFLWIQWILQMTARLN